MQCMALPVLFLEYKKDDQKPMSSMPAGLADFFSLISVIAQSVVRSKPLMLAAFCRAIRSTFVGTMTPA